MKIQKAQLYLNDDGSNLILSVKTPDGIERFIDIFSGSGYYEAIWLRTADEIEQSRIAHKKADDEWIDSQIERAGQKNKKKWWQFWKF